MRNNIVSYADQIRHQLWLRKWGQVDFINHAKEVGWNVTSSAICLWCTGKQYPSVKNLNRITEVFDLNPVEDDNG